MAVEFALVLPLLVGLIMGTIDWGYYFFVSEIVGNAAREGARAGSVFRGAPANICLPTGPVQLGVVDYLQRGRLIANSADTRLKAFDCTNPMLSCCQLVTVATANDAVRVRIAYQTKPGGSGSMSITGVLPTSLLPSTAATVATMRLEP